MEKFNKDESSKSQSTSQTTKLLEHLKSIFGEKFINENGSKILKDGKIDFEALTQVLIERGHSKEFVDKFVGDLNKGKVTESSIKVYQQAAKDDLLNKEGLKKMYGKHGAAIHKEFWNAFMNGNLNKAKRILGIITILDKEKENWQKKQVSESVQKIIFDYANGEIDKKTFKDEMMKNILNEVERLHYMKIEAAMRDFESTGGQNYEKIAGAKNIEELKKVAIKAGLFNEITWNNLVNEIMIAQAQQRAQMLPYQQQQLLFITQILNYYQQAYDEAEEMGKEKTEKGKNRELSEEEERFREFGKGYVEALKADGKKEDVEALILNNLKENEDRINKIAEIFMSMMTLNGKMDGEERRVLETLAGKRPPVDFATLSPQTRDKLLRAIRKGLVGYA